jgi:hypothetical protein
MSGDSLDGRGSFLMRTISRLFLVLGIVLSGAVGLAAEQQAAVRRNVNLRSDPSTENPPIELISADSIVTLLNRTPQNGYYHVRAADRQEGWVWANNIALASQTSNPTTPSPAAALSAPSPNGERQAPPELYPDLSRTPGVPNADITQENIGDNICSMTWSTREIRPTVSLTNSLKVQQMTEYGDNVSDENAACPFHSDNRKCYEEDHLIALEDGGAPKDPQNLWPEPYNTQVDGNTVGAHQKDIVEGFIHDEICFGIPNSKKNSRIPAHTSITLQRGREILATSWYACYLSIQRGEACQ